MANKRGKKIDTTHLSIEFSMKRGFLHRDYIAHCFRWSHAIKYLHQGGLYKTAKVLDVGCGVDVPLARAMFSSRLTNREGLFVGVDVNKLGVPKMLEPDSFQIELHGETDLCEWNTEHKFDLITCFEVLEHVEPEHMVRMVQKMKSLLAPGGTIMISTPCYDPNTGAADNHVNEISYEVLGSVFEACGLNTDTRYGTFASQKDYKKQLEVDGYLPLFKKLGEFYDSNVLSTIFAPLYPHLSRNCLWQLSDKPIEKRNFETLQAEMLQGKTFGSSTEEEWAKALTLLTGDKVEAA